MADKPIIFSAPMVRALLEGRKTQTRRVLKEQNSIADAVMIGGFYQWKSWKTGCVLGDVSVPYAPGSRLYVREACHIDGRKVSYRADADPASEPPGPWRPSIHMPRWASRLTLLVTDVRVQRLQEISGEDCIAEGADCDTCACNQRGCFEIRRNFHDLWNSLHGPEAWDANPWVCAVSFTAHRCNIDQMREK